MAAATVRPLAAAAAVGMWIVLVMGATVTNTGSQTGCGPSWPLCRGQFIPQMAVSTAIEYSHRTAVGIESVLILAFAGAAWVLYSRRAEMRLLVPAMVLFLFLQAGLGAWAVMAPQAAAVLALHFGVSLIAFASVVLTAMLVFDLATPRGQERDALRDVRASSRLSHLIWSLAGFTYLVVYLGAYVRHSKADDGCSGWPLCNGSVIPGLHGPTGVAFAHRAAALLLLMGVGTLMFYAYRHRGSRPDLWVGSTIVGLLVLLQGISGAVVALTDTDLFSALAHAGIVALLFAALCQLCLRVTARPTELPVASTPNLPRSALAGGYEMERVRG